MDNDQEKMTGVCPVCKSTDLGYSSRDEEFDVQLVKCADCGFENIDALFFKDVPEGKGESLEEQETGEEYEFDFAPEMSEPVDAGNFSSEEWGEIERGTRISHRLARKMSQFVLDRLWAAGIEGTRVQTAMNMYYIQNTEDPYHVLFEVATDGVRTHPNHVYFNPIELPQTVQAGVYSLLFNLGFEESIPPNLEPYLRAFVKVRRATRESLEEQETGDEYEFDFATPELVNKNRLDRVVGRTATEAEGVAWGIIDAWPERISYTGSEIDDEFMVVLAHRVYILYGRFAQVHRGSYGVGSYAIDAARNETFEPSMAFTIKSNEYPIEADRNEVWIDTYATPLVLRSILDKILTILGFVARDTDDMFTVYEKVAVVESLTEQETGEEYDFDFSVTRGPESGFIQELTPMFGDTATVARLDDEWSISVHTFNGEVMEAATVRVDPTTGRISGWIDMVELESVQGATAAALYALLDEYDILHEIQGTSLVLRQANPFRPSDAELADIVTDFIDEQMTSETAEASEQGGTVWYEDFMAHGGIERVVTIEVDDGDVSLNVPYFAQAVYERIVNKLFTLGYSYFGQDGEVVHYSRVGAGGDEVTEQDSQTPVKPATAIAKPGQEGPEKTHSGCKFYASKPGVDGRGRCSRFNKDVVAAEEACASYEVRAEESLEEQEIGDEYDFDFSTGDDDVDDGDFDPDDREAVWGELTDEREMEDHPFYDFVAGLAALNRQWVLEETNEESGRPDPAIWQVRMQNDTMTSYNKIFSVEEEPIPEDPDWVEMTARVYRAAGEENYRRLVDAVLRNGFIPSIELDNMAYFVLRFPTNLI